MRTDTVHLSDKKNTKLVAHRGVSGLECENTAAAFIAAGNRTYYGVETDIYRTNDGHYICNHDGRTGRISEVDLVIETSSFDELRSIRLKDTDGKSDRAELMLATPEEYVKICKKYGKVCVPELKSNFTIEEIKDIIDIFANEDYLDSTCFIAFGMDNLKKIKSILPNQQCQYLSGHWNDEYPKMLKELGMGLDIEQSSLTEERIKACHDCGVEVNAWTVDGVENAERLISWGIDYITSNILE